MRAFPLWYVVHSMNTTITVNDYIYMQTNYNSYVSCFYDAHDYDACVCKVFKGLCKDTGRELAVKVVRDINDKV